MKEQKRLNMQRWRRTNRVRRHLHGSTERPRLAVFRSNGHLYCQVIDDDNGKTIASASTRDKDLREQIKHGGNCEAAKAIGTAIAERAKAAGVSMVQFDRGKYRYHGRVAELATAARAGGLQF